MMLPTLRLDTSKLSMVGHKVSTEPGCRSTFISHSGLTLNPLVQPVSSIVLLSPGNLLATLLSPIKVCQSESYVYDLPLYLGTCGDKPR